MLQGMLVERDLISRDLHILLVATWPDSCNPVLLNCLYGHGVIQSILTTFEATSQLWFVDNRTPAYPMKTDDGIVKSHKKEWGKRKKKEKQHVG